MRINLTTKGNFEKTTKFLDRIKQIGNSSIFDKYGEMGVEALSKATPVDTGLTASSWGYQVERKFGSTTITWTNSNINSGVNIAVIIQQGHGTGTGGYVKGIDYINPALKPIFEQIKDALWREVTE